MKKATSFASALTILCLWPAAQAYAASCESLTGLSLPNVKVTLAEQVAAGTFAPRGAGGGGRGGGIANLPAFCRVAATLTPTSDSDIKNRSVAAGVGLEREVPGRRKRRLAGVDWLRRHG